MRRRSNGDGYIYRQKNGTWVGQLMDGYKDNGRKNIRTFSGSTKSEVQAEMRRFAQAKEDGLIPTQILVTFSEWADTWYASYKERVQPSTYANYKYTVKVLTDYFGTKPIANIRQLDVSKFLDHITQSGCSESKISKCKAMLIQIFNFAIENEVIEKNPALYAKIPKRRTGFYEEEEQKKDAFSDAEVEILFQNLPDDLLGNSILLMLGSGIRTQELLALTPSDISEDGSVVKVSKAIKMVDGCPTLGPPKSRTSRREIPIPEKYRVHARYLREHGDSSRIWLSTRDDGLYSVGTFRRQYYKAVKAVQHVRNLSPHCCRHTYVTRLQAKGVPIDLIARLTGHSDIRTTDHYAHASNQTLADAVALINE